MNWLGTVALSTAVGYVLVDALICAVVLVRGRDLEWDLVAPPPVFWVILAVVASEVTLLLVVTVWVATRSPALAIFPMLGACWVGADFFPLMAGKDKEVSRVKVTSPLTVIFGISLAAGLVMVQILIGGSRS